MARTPTLREAIRRAREIPATGRLVMTFASFFTRSLASVAALLSIMVGGLCFGLHVPAAAHPHGDPFLIGLAPQQDPEKVFQMMQPFLQYMEREVKYKFTFETAPTIPEFQKRVLEGRYDLWWGNPLTYVQANKTI